MWVFHPNFVNDWKYFKELFDFPFFSFSIEILGIDIFSIYASSPVYGFQILGIGLEWRRK